MADTLHGMKVAIVVDNGFEQSEMTEPRKALDEAGAKTVLISPQKDQVKGWTQMDWGKSFPVDVPLDKANPDDYDALLLPGGVMNPDKLRMNPKAMQFISAFVREHKPIAAICHGPWTLVEAGAVQGKTLTSWPSLHTDITNAGGHWVDQTVVEDDNIVTSRKPDDIPAFNQTMIQMFAAKVPARQR